MGDNKIVILLIRHGNTKFNKEKIFRGHTDIPLDDTGLDQAVKTGKLLRDINISNIYCSPLSRAVQTAGKILTYQKKPAEVIEEKGFLDLSFGDWEGKSFEEARNEYPDIYNTWVRTPHLTHIPGGETLTQAKERSWKALTRIVEGYKRKDGLQIFAVVSHRVINKLIINSILGLDESKFWQIKQDPCCINIFEYQYENYFVSKINHSSHIYDIEESIMIMDF
jgi:broad specificity phosphatase PhoE